MCAHFGHCDEFALIDVDREKGTIIKQEFIDAPEHQPGLLPEWLSEKGVNTIIAGGMGSRAQELFGVKNISVMTGAYAESPEKLVTDLLQGNLNTGENVCDH